MLQIQVVNFIIMMTLQITELFLVGITLRKPLFLTDSSRVNFEIVLNFSDMSIEFRYGNVDPSFPVHDNHNTMIGISGEIDKDEYEQFYFNTSNGLGFGSERNVENRVFKYVLDTTDTDKDIVAKQNQELDPVSSLKYTPEGNPSPSVDNIFKPSEVKSSAVVGSKNDFIWMNLDKAAVNISYNTPSLANPGGYALILQTLMMALLEQVLMLQQHTICSKTKSLSRVSLIQKTFLNQWLINMEIILKG